MQMLRGPAVMFHRGEVSGFVPAPSRTQETGVPSLTEIGGAPETPSGNECAMTHGQLHHGPRAARAVRRGAAR